ncbi:MULTISPECIES: helix-turn-helix domain-containing protein [unclassified Microbacterium]|uniref:winged helix-turn-helix domain-containing protein n=1 Tax=unclassified Microbacterium TaxID=2609290 RepID=UPI0018E05BAA|nr:helix-turn-helix domain-containing protein [Microbacterium sp. MAH-37]
MAEQEERTSRTMTTAMLKVFANPLRRDMMRVFAKKEFLRAADIADELGQPANKISFHLRVMADAGLIVEAPEQARDGRDRVWTPIKESLNIGAAANDEDIALGNAVVAALAEDHAALMQRVVAHAVATLTDEEHGQHGTLMVNNLRLTQAEFTALTERLSREIRAAEEAHDRSDPDGRAWQLDIVAADDTI